MPQARQKPLPAGPMPRRPRGTAHLPRPVDCHAPSTSCNSQATLGSHWHRATWRRTDGSTAAMLTVSCTVTTRIPWAAAHGSAALRSRALACQPRCDAQTDSRRRVEEAQAVRRRRLPAVVQQPAHLVAPRSFRQPTLTPELAAATAEFRAALVEHLGWPNHAAQAAADEVGGRVGGCGPVSPLLPSLPLRPCCCAFTGCHAYSSKPIHVHRLQAANSRTRNFYKYASEVPSAAVIRGWAAWLG